jgi:hypothetical protein
VAELSGSCIQLREPERASYSELGARIEQLLGLAVEQASALVDAARTEAAKITESAGPRQPCPRCGAVRSSRRWQEVETAGKRERTCYSAKFRVAETNRNLQR